jgi:lipoprotein-anchoring transpeptidase ErfK/SrfK
MTVVRNGADNNTPTGTWTLQAKYRDLHLKGTDANGSWDDPVQYWMPFDQADGIGFHDASWQTFPFGSSQYHTDGSHGCVHLPAKFISWLYAWSSIGTTVIVQF